MTWSSCRSQNQPRLSGASQAKKLRRKSLAPNSPPNQVFGSSCTLAATPLRLRESVVSLRAR
jgi:hypothetical protein